MKARNLGLWIIGLLLCTGCPGSLRWPRHLERAEAFFAKQRYPEAVIEYMNVLRWQPDHPSAARNLGISAYECRDYEKAYPWLMRSAERKRDDYEVLNRLAAVQWQRGDRAAARALAEEVLAARPDDLEASLIWATTSTEAIQMDAALSRLEEAAGIHAGNARLHLAIGWLHMRRENYDAALAAFDEAIRCAPDHADAYIARGDLHMTQRRAEQAGGDFQRARELSPGATVAGIRWALYLRATGKDEAARRELDRILKDEPDYVPARYERAVLDFARNNYDHAAADAVAILEKEPGHLPARLLRIHALKQSGQREKAFAELESAARMFPHSPPVLYEQARRNVEEGDTVAAMDHLREALRINPNHADVIILLSELEIQRGEYDAALARLPGLLQGRSPLQPAALLLLGQAHRLRGNFSAAIAAYEALARVKADDAHPLYLIGLTHRAAGRNAAALDSFRRALGNNPMYLPALNALVAMHGQEGRADLARQLVDERLAAQPDSAGLLHLRASLSMSSGELDEAGRFLKEAIRCDPGMTEAYRDLARLYIQQQNIDSALETLSGTVEQHPRDATARMMLGVLLQGVNRVPDAIAQYEEILRIDPDFTGALNNLAYLLITTRPDESNRALALARRARERAPRDPAVADTLGLVAMQRREYPWAISLLQESAAQLAGHPEVQWHYAQALLGVGREDEARAALTRALDSRADFPGRDEARHVWAILQLTPERISSESPEELTRILAAVPEHPASMVRQAMLKERQGCAAEAIALHQNVLEQWPDFLPALLAITRMSVDDHGQALTAGRRARQLAPDHPEVAFELGRAALRLGDYAWAFGLLAEAAAALPGRVDVLYYHALAAIMQGQVGLAAELLRSAVDDPDAARFRDLLSAYQDASVEWSRGQVDAALMPVARLIDAARSPDAAAFMSYQALIKDFPGWILPVRDYAARLVAAGDVREQTIELARRAREALPRDIVARRTYAIALARFGPASEAAFYLRDYLASEPDDEEAMAWLQSCEQKSTADMR